MSEYFQPLPISLRHKIAIHLMAGLLSNSAYMEGAAKTARSDEALTLRIVAVAAVRATDALLAELNQQTP